MAPTLPSNRSSQEVYQDTPANLQVTATLAATEDLATESTLATRASEGTLSDLLTLVGLRIPAGAVSAIAERLLSGASSAAALLASALAVLGATTGAAVVSDAAGTIQQYLRGLVTMQLDLVLTEVLDLSGDDETAELELSGRSLIGVQITGAAGDHVGSFAVQTTADGATYDAETLVDEATGLQSTSIPVAAAAAIGERAAIGPLAASHVKVVYTRTGGGAAQDATVTIRARRV